MLSYHELVPRDDNVGYVLPDNFLRYPQSRQATAVTNTLMISDIFIVIKLPTDYLINMSDTNP